MTGRTPARTFRFSAFDATGTLTTGSVDAPSAEGAMAVLRQRGLTPIEADAESDALMAPERRLFSASGPTRREIILLTRELSVLGQAGVPLDDALRISRDEAGSARLRGLVADLLTRVLDGARFSAALEAHPSSFPDEYRTILRAGEAAGSWAGALAELADLLRKRQEIAAKTSSAMVYPAMLVLMAIVSIAVIAGVLVPNVAPIFIANGRPPPPLLAFVLWSEDAWPSLAIGAGSVIGVMMALSAAIARSDDLRRRRDRVILSLPVVGALLLQQSMARFARTLAALLRAGSPMLDAVGAAAETLGNRHLRHALNAVLAALREGTSLSRALSRITPMPRIVTSMSTVGEETAKLPLMLSHLADWLEDQADRRVERLMTLLTPVLTLAIAALVGGLMLSVMTAIMSINDLATH